MSKVEGPFAELSETQRHFLKNGVYVFTSRFAYSYLKILGSLKKTIKLQIFH